MGTRVFGEKINPTPAAIPYLVSKRYLAVLESTQKYAQDKTPPSVSFGKPGEQQSCLRSNRCRLSDWCQQSQRHARFGWPELQCHFLWQSMVALSLDPACTAARSLTDFDRLDMSLTWLLPHDGILLVGVAGCAKPTSHERAAKDTGGGV